MSSKILLISAEQPDPETFLDLIEDLGGERRPSEWVNGHIRRGDAHIWVTVDPDSVPEVEVEHWLEHEEKLGVTPHGVVELRMSGGVRADAIAMEVIEAAAGRWRLIVDDDHGGLHSVEELREYPEGRLPFGGR
ncbi:hypothetical protein [Actinomadura sp. 6K520]|uniref:hypothetical protein n=1 Tax=Actinomadura sp. 6K520 TaxID=2530364 RepID=UPI00104412E4|nr:hypothetical protein [Actinomadura sp. 6K520]TDE26551.1 hypothetical protein E1289_25165 [Actinomadura sp. 6K520]